MVIARKSSCVVDLVMRAIRFEVFGDHSVLELTEVPTPAADENTAVVRVMAASISGWSGFAAIEREWMSTQGHTRQSGGNPPVRRMSIISTLTLSDERPASNRNTERV